MRYAIRGERGACFVSFVLCSILLSGTVDANSQMLKSP